LKPWRGWRGCSHDRSFEIACATTMIGVFGSELPMPHQLGA